jgi:hypothetical protein
MIAFIGFVQKLSFGSYVSYCDHSCMMSWMWFISFGFFEGVYQLGSFCVFQHVIILLVDFL